MENQALPSEKNNLIEQISAPVSKVNTLLIANHIIYSPAQLPTLYHIIWHSKMQIQWRASWVLEQIFLTNPNLVNPYLEDMISQFETIKSDGVKRHISKILSLSQITDKVNGHFINTCFDWLISELIPVAVKVHCMQILFNITKEYPDLKHELKTVLETQIPNNSIGFKSRAKKIIKTL